MTEPVMLDPITLISDSDTSSAGDHESINYPEHQEGSHGYLTDEQYDYLREKTDRLIEAVSTPLGWTQ